MSAGVVAAHYVAPGGASGSVAAYKTAVLADIPWGAWDLTETSGTSLADYSGNNRPFTITGAPTLNLAGPADAKAIDWPASTSVYASAATMSASNFTLEAWVYLTALPSGRVTILGNGASPTGTVQRELGLAINAQGKPDVFTWNGSDQFLTAPNALALNSWYHVAGMLSGTTGMRLRINKVASGTLAQNVGSLGRAMWMHAGGYGTTAQSIRIALPALYATALSDARIDAHYDALMGA